MYLVDLAPLGPVAAPTLHLADSKIPRPGNAGTQHSEPGIRVSHFLDYALAGQIALRLQFPQFLRLRVIAAAPARNDLTQVLVGRPAEGMNSFLLTSRAQ